MIKIHHLGVSQSDRIVWLMEELGLPYELKWYTRGDDGLMPPEYRKLHPAATAPVIDPEMMSADTSWRRNWLCRRPAGGSTGRNASVRTSVETLRLPPGSADVAFVLKTASLLWRRHHAQDY